MKKIEFFESNPSLQYIWIGPPFTIMGGSLDIDAQGPVEMSEALVAANSTNQIVFYCLEEQLASFTDIFSSHANIEVRSIDAFFTQRIGDDAHHILKRAKLIFDEDKYGDINTRVDAKNLASLMLLYLKGDYYLDTTVFPDGDKITFRSYDCFMVPLFSEDPLNRLIKYKSNSGTIYKIPFFNRNDGTPESYFVKQLHNFKRTESTEAHNMVDVFAMFSPIYNRGVFRAIETYVQFFPVLERSRSVDLDDEIANTSACLIDTAVNNGYFMEKKQSKWLTPFTVDEECGVKRILKSIGCYKKFANSHGTQYPDLNSSFEFY